MAKSKIEQLLRESASLVEDEINISKGEVVNPDDMIDAGMDNVYVEPVADADFDEENDATYYAGKHVLFCNICMRPFFNETSVDETTVCPMCQAESEDLVEVGIVQVPETNEPAEETNPEGEAPADEEPADLPAEEPAIEEEGVQQEGNAVNEDVTVNVSADTDATVTVNSNDASVEVNADDSKPEEVAPVEPSEPLDAEPALSDEDEGDDLVGVPEFEYEEESFNKLFNKFLTDNYKNVKSFNLVESKLTDEGLVFEGLITFDNDNTRTVVIKSDNFELTEGTSKVKASCPLFGKSKAFVIEHVVKENKITPTTLNYRYRARVNNEAYEVIGRAVID